MKTYSKLNTVLFLTLFLLSFAGTAQKGSSLSIGNGTLVESELYTHSKKVELLTIEDSKKTLFSKVKKSDKKAEQQLQQLKMKENKLKENIEAGQEKTQLAMRAFKIKPLPPCPPKTDGKCAIDRIKNLLVADDIRSILVRITNGSGKTIGTMDTKPMMKENGFKAYIIKMKEPAFSGPATIKVTKVDGQGIKTSYSYEAFVN
ncbi:hypothetical protein [Maribacter sp. IgM3_T14_3]|uniref:hypothetical protein n=1 Tax=Maribacter sp. IgM3_T14_3 TaxID=3415140 RepID=UPI003C6EE0FD